MHLSHPIASETWTVPQAVATIDRDDRSGASTEPPQSFANSWVELTEAGYARKPCVDDDAAAEPILALTDCEFEARPSERAKLFRELATKQADARSVTQRMSLRISYLKSEAKSEGEPFDPASEQDFWKFMNSLPFIKKPRIFLVDNGDLRAVWKGDCGEHVGFQFLGDGWIQYVVFAKRPDARVPSRVYGRDTFEGILRQIAALEIQDLLHA